MGVWAEGAEKRHASTLVDIAKSGQHRRRVTMQRARIQLQPDAQLVIITRAPADLLADDVEHAAVLQDVVEATWL